MSTTMSRAAAMQLGSGAKSPGEGAGRHARGLPCHDIHRAVPDHGAFDYGPAAATHCLEQRRRIGFALRHAVSAQDHHRTGPHPQPVEDCREKRSGLLVTTAEQFPRQRLQQFGHPG